MAQGWRIIMAAFRSLCLDIELLNVVELVVVQGLSANVSAKCRVSSRCLCYSLCYDSMMSVNVSELESSMYVNSRGV